MNLTEPQLDEMDFSQVDFIAEALIEKEIKEEKRTMRAAALHAWLTGSASKKTYNDFIISLGLGEENLFTEQDKKEAIKKSKEVIDKLNKLRGKK